MDQTNSRLVHIEAFHASLLTKQVDESYALSGWSSRRSQEQRFEALLRNSGFQSGAIVDYGCGTGDLLAYLRKTGLNFSYLGLDHDPRMIERATRLHGPYFKHIPFDEVEFDPVDYVFASGIFQFKDAADPTYYVPLIEKLFARCSHALAANFLSSMRRETQKNADELYLLPKEVLKLAQSTAQFWAIDHSYHSGLGDVTVGLHKRNEDLDWMRPLF